jgi:MFS family permease
LNPKQATDLATSQRFLLAFTLLSSFMGISVGLARVTTSLYALDLHASDTMLGLIAGSQTIGILVMGLPVGVLVDHFGPARLFVLGTVLAGITYFLTPMLPTAEFLLLCSTLISFFMPLRFISLNTVFMTQLAALGESKAGWFRGTHMIGFFLLGPILAPPLVALLNFDGTFWLIAAAFAVTLLGGPFVFAHYREHQTHTRRFRWADVISQLGLLRTDAELRETCLLEFFTQAINGFYSFFIIVIAIETFHLSKDDASRLVAAEGLSLIVALFLLGRLARSFSQAHVYLGSFVWVIVSLMVLGLTHAGTGLWIGGLALGLGVGMLEIVNLTRFARLSGVLGRGKIAGLNALVGPGGSLFGSIFGGIIGPVFGLQAVFVLFALPFLIFGGHILWQAADARIWTILHQGLKRLAIIALSASLLLGVLLLLRPVIAIPYAASLVLFAAVWLVLVTATPGTKGRIGVSALLASLLGLLPLWVEHHTRLNHWLEQLSR